MPARPRRPCTESEPGNKSVSDTESWARRLREGRIDRDCGLRLTRAMPEASRPRPAWLPPPDGSRDRRVDDPTNVWVVHLAGRMLLPLAIKARIPANAV